MTHTGNPIPKHVSQRFDTMMKAHDNGHLCLVSSTRKADGKQVYILAAAVELGNGMVDLIPFGDLNVPDDPYEVYNRP